MDPENDPPRLDDMRDRLDYLHALALMAAAAGLLEADRRALLLEGLDHQQRAGLVRHPRPLDQAFADVCALSRDDVRALDTWLRNCAFLARTPEALFFMEARTYLRIFCGPRRKG